MDQSTSLSSVPSSVSTLTLVSLSLVVGLCLWVVRPQLHGPLRGYPGPFLAGCTDLWRLYHVWRGNSHLVIEALHKKYGPVVRIGPNLLDLDFPELAKKIYNIKGDWLKTPFYHGSSVLGPNGQVIYNLFSQTDNELHAREKRPIAKFYSISGIIPLEPLIDSVVQKLCNELEQRFMNPPNTDKTCNLGDWILYYAWDVVGSVTFSEPIGYLEKGHDFNGILWAADRAIDYFCVVGQIPILDFWFDKNPVHRIGPPGFGTAVNIAVGQMVNRLQGKAAPDHDPNNPDFLDKFIEAKSIHPEIVDDGQIISYLMINMLAGADTTAITIRSVLYYTMRNPQVWKRLQKELGTTEDVVVFKDARASSYLDACVREAMRMHPPVGMIMERFVPPQGLDLPDGTKIPPGVAVGLNPYIINRNTSVWGDDVETFRPERWLQEVGESEQSFSARLANMNACDLTFGAGSRICIGKHLGLVETYKVVATLVARYNIELAHPQKEWHVINSWFMRQEGIEVRISKR